MINTIIKKQPEHIYCQCTSRIDGWESLQFFDNFIALDSEFGGVELVLLDLFGRDARFGINHDVEILILDARFPTVISIDHDPAQMKKKRIKVHKGRQTFRSRNLPTLTMKQIKNK